MKKRLLLAALLTLGCGNSLQVNIPPSGGGSDNNNNNNPGGLSLRELIVIPNLSDNTITVKQVNLDDGTTFTRATVSSGAQGPFVVKCSPTMNVFYVLNSNSGLITEFRIDINGNVSSIGNIASPANPLLMTIHPSGRLVFVAGTGRQVFTYGVNNDGTLTLVAQTTTNFLNGTPGLDADFSGNGAFLHLPVVGGVQTCAIQNDGSLVSSSLNNAGGSIGAADQVLDVDVHPGQTSLQAAIQRAGNDAIASFAINGGALTPTGGATTVNYEVGLGDFSAPGRYYLGESGTPRVHGFNTVAATGALTELATSPSISSGLNALYTQMDFTSSYLFTTQSVGSNLLISRPLSGAGEFNDSNVDNQNLAAPQLFDFFLVQVSGS
ncbi:MAG: beta-propeller fold lactonase family protein [Candidatus Eremiobacteraeota bacterium]|nr:beta-propeller fold lactonase family protein [Candidatus Eremiobacteraeota bacterium]MCW5869344.1 beta-propeller fold lactonase family protein [Candidatus Eremiobacteraeota bacterium]